MAFLTELLNLPQLGLSSIGLAGHEVVNRVHMVKGESFSERYPHLAAVNATLQQLDSGEIASKEALEDVSHSLCTNKYATRAEIDDAMDPKIKLFFLGNFGSVVSASLDCACSVGFAEEVITTIKASFLAIPEPCRNEGPNTTLESTVCKPADLVSVIKTVLTTLVSGKFLCSSACRDPIANLLDKMYGLLKVTISFDLLFKSLLIPPGSALFDCMCRDDVNIRETNDAKIARLRSELARLTHSAVAMDVEEPAVDAVPAVPVEPFALPRAETDTSVLGALIDVGFAPLVEAGNFSSAALEKATAQFMQSPEYHQRVVAIAFSESNMCCASCKALLDDFVVIYDAASVQNPDTTSRSRLAEMLPDGPVAELSMPGGDGRTVGEVLSCSGAAGALETEHTMRGLGMSASVAALLVFVLIVFKGHMVDRKNAIAIM